MQRFPLCCARRDDVRVALARVAAGVLRARCWGLHQVKHAGSSLSQAQADEAEERCALDERELRRMAECVGSTDACAQKVRPAIKHRA